MVRYYGIYARPVREKIHALVAGALQVLVRRAEQVAQFFARKQGLHAQPYRQKLEERFGKGEMRRPACGSTNMLLIRIWSKAAGVVYEWGRDLSARVHAQAGDTPPARGPACRSRFGIGGLIAADLTPQAPVALPPIYRQMVLAI